MANVIEAARVGGPQRRIAAVAARLRPRGIETVVIGPAEGSGRLRALLEENGVTYLALRLQQPSKGLIRLFRYGLLFVPEVARLARALKRGDFELVHVSGGSWQLKGVFAAQIAGLPILWHLNDTRTPLAIRMVFHLVSGLIPTSFVIAGRRVHEYYLAGKSPEKLRVFEIQAPVDVERFDPDRVEPHSALADRGCPLVVLLGVISADKGLSTFVESAARVVAALPRAEFWIAGPTRATQVRYREGVERLIEEMGLQRNVRFMGATDEPETVLAAADVVVCSSRSEASPMAVWEAMAMAKPVVSTDVGDVRRLLEESGAGFVVAVGDASGVARHVTELLADAELRSTMGRRGREVAMAHLSLDRCVEEHARAYRSVAGAASPAPAAGL